MKIRLQEYIKEDGTSPYQEWFDRLDAQAAAKVAVAKTRMELGNTSKIKWFRGIGEYVIDWGPGYRIYLAQDGGELIVLFGGSTKRDQQKVIDQAVDLHEEYKARKKLLASKKGKK
ncbi:MAG: type II toxin-antitoxin system RelE/ParE family toxin [Pseudomonadota bacterium]